MLFKIFLVLIIVLTNISKAQAYKNQALPFSDQTITAVAESNKWQKLIKIEQNSLLKNSEFAVHSQSFYFSNIKTLTAKSELINTLKALLADKAYITPDENPQCRFPARYIWLKTQFDLSQIQTVTCEKFLKWSKLPNSKSLSLIFATGYLGNPASYYGHTLLKLNSDKKTTLDLLETSVNFGANVPEDEDPITYIIKGVIGGYDANFTHSKFYYHTQNYLENELRDLWEYQLNLDKDDYQFLVAHIWELIGQNFTYYFFDKNCVFRMYELFELIDDIKLPSIKAPWVIPQEAARAINSATYKNLPLVKKTIYIPSRQANFYSKYWQLNKLLKSSVKAIVLDIEQLKLLNNSKMQNEDKLKVLSVLLDYYQYLLAIDNETKLENEGNYGKILAYRYQLPIGKAQFYENVPISPHNSRPSSYIQAAVLHNRKLGNGYTFKLRPAYYDQLDAESGHVKNGVLKMAELDLEYLSDKLSIRQFSIFEVLSVKSQASGLPQDDYDAWRLYLGLKKQEDNCLNCTDFTFQGSKGWAVPLNNFTTLGAYFGGAFVENYQDRGRVYASSHFTLNQIINDNWNFMIDIEARKYLENEQISLFNYRFETRYKYIVNQNYFDFRLALSEHETQLSLGYYW